MSGAVPVGAVVADASGGIVAAGRNAAHGPAKPPWISGSRLAHAEVALREPRTSLKDVAFRVGYNHANNFINAFTRRYGAPPRQHTERQRRRDH